MSKDAFVRGILDDDDAPDPLPRPEDCNAALLAREKSESLRTFPGNDSPLAKYGSNEFADSPRGVSGADTDTPKGVARAQSLFRYSLIFINFTFIVAAMLLIMAGIVARENAAVKLCSGCGQLTTVSIVFGMGLWLLAVFGFNWIRQRNIFLLLVYVAFLVVLLLVLAGVIVAAGIFERTSSQSGNGQSWFLDQWESSVNATPGQVCNLQQQFNCSGYCIEPNCTYGCCAPGCYNASNPPAWVDRVCPSCPGVAPVPRVCTDIVFVTLRRNLGGFLVISGFSMMLIFTGMLLAFLTRKMNQILE
jgi:hypothetical protein